MTIISDNIRRIRKLRGLDQIQLAELMGVSDKTISSWEVGRTEPKMGKIEKLCSVLKCNKSDIIENKDSNKYYSTETAKMAQNIYENSELKLLFDAAIDADPEDLKTVHSMLLALKRKEFPND